MRKRLVCLALVGLVAGTAVAEPFTNPVDRSQVPIYTSVTAEPIGQGASPRGEGRTAIYSNMIPVGPLHYISAQSQSVSGDDFNKGPPPDPNQPVPLAGFSFIGGVSAANQVLLVTFFSSSGPSTYPIPLASFAIQFPYPGIYAWTINLSQPYNIINRGGTVMMWADDGSVVTPSTGIWAFDTGLPTVGTTGPTYPGFTHEGVPENHKFAIFIPEPGTLALLGMGVMILVPRGRR